MNYLIAFGVGLLTGILVSSAMFERDQDNIDEERRDWQFQSCQYECIIDNLRMHNEELRAKIQHMEIKR